MRLSVERGFAEFLESGVPWSANPNSPGRPRRRTGNLVFRKIARSFSPMITTCGRATVAEIEELVGIGELDPEQIHVPGIYVDSIIQGAVDIIITDPCVLGALPRSPV